MLCSCAQIILPHHSTRLQVLRRRRARRRRNLTIDKVKIKEGYYATPATRPRPSCAGTRRPAQARRTKTATWRIRLEGDELCRVGYGDGSFKRSSIWVQTAPETSSTHALNRSLCSTCRDVYYLDGMRVCIACDSEEAAEQSQSAGSVILPIFVGVLPCWESF